MPRPAARLGSLLVAALVALACTADDGADGRDGAEPGRRGRAGDVVELRERHDATVPDGARSWDVRYLSTGVHGDLVPVTGVVWAPVGAAPSEGRPVLAWAHGTTGIADRCAPSRREPSVPGLGPLLADGFVVAATDYEGLGTPGVHPYLVGASAGRSVLDAARAAGGIDGAAAGERTVVVGHSQGGHAALFAGILQPEHAPELDVLGVVASAPAAELVPLLRRAAGIPQTFGFVAAAAYAYADTYGLDVEEVLTPAAVDRLAVVEEACMGDVLSAYAERPPSAWLAADPLGVPAWARRIEQNEPGSRRVAAPVLVVQGTADLVVPAPLTETAVSRLCRGGNVVELRRYRGADHGSVLPAAADDVLAWIAGRVAGAPAASTCD